MDEQQKRELQEICPRGLQFDVPMAPYTTFRVGGRADALFFAGDLDVLQGLVVYLGGKAIPYLPMGRGSNLIMSDAGYRGVVLMLQGRLARVGRGEDEDVVAAGGGLNIVELLAYCSHRGLGGVEFLAGIPGTVGGAVAMNAGAWGKDMGTVVREVEWIASSGALEIRDRAGLQFSYRGCALAPGAVIVRVLLETTAEGPEIVSGRIADILKRRKAAQPLEYPSGGSVFKNPPGDVAGRLIESVGLKGERVGGAMVSPKHANFIVNTGGATAADILALMDRIRETVRKQTGVDLEPEIRVIG